MPGLAATEIFLQEDPFRVIEVPEPGTGVLGDSHRIV